MVPGSSQAAKSALATKFGSVAAVPAGSVEVMTTTPTITIKTRAIAFGSEELACLIRCPSI